MNKLVSVIENDSRVKRYIYLRNILLSNSDYSRLLNSDLSLNNANIESFALENLVNEYKELSFELRNDLEMIGNIINNELNIDFLSQMSESA